MSGFENFSRQAAQLELEIERKGIALGIDWNDAAAVDALARDALAYRAGHHAHPHDDIRQYARAELFGLAHLMLQVMKESALENIETHGGPVWKALGGALWRNWQINQGKQP